MQHSTLQELVSLEYRQCIEVITYRTTISTRGQQVSIANDHRACAAAHLLFPKLSRCCASQSNATSLSYTSPGFSHASIIIRSNVLQVHRREKRVAVPGQRSHSQLRKIRYFVTLIQSSTNSNEQREGTTPTEFLN